MSHRSWNVLFCIVASFALLSVARSDEPNADDAAAAAALIAKANATAGKPAGGKSQSVTTIVVNGGPSADILRSARDAGFTVKISFGKTHFCKSEAPIGSRLVSEHCLNEEQLTLFLARAEDQRETLKHLIGAPEKSN
jgi:hypothetical protein